MKSQSPRVLRDDANLRRRSGLFAILVVVFAAETAFSQPFKPVQDRGRTVKPSISEAVATFETSDGVVVQGTYYRPKPEPKGVDKLPVAICIHMYPVDRNSWMPIMFDLCHGGFAVLAYDIRGNGESVNPADKNLVKQYSERSPEFFADAWKDVEAAKKWLKEQPKCDASRVVLIGASVGCSIAMDYAGRDPDVKGIICLSPGVDYMGLDSIAHIKKLQDRKILLLAPKGEYGAVKKLIKASGGAARGKSYKGGEENHGTRLFDASYGGEVKKKVVAFAQSCVSESKKNGKDKDKDKDKGGDSGKNDGKPKPRRPTRGK